MADQITMITANLTFTRHETFLINQAIMSRFKWNHKPVQFSFTFSKRGNTSCKMYLQLLILSLSWAKNVIVKYLLNNITLLFKYHQLLHKCKIPINDISTSLSSISDLKKKVLPTILTEGPGPKFISLRYFMFEGEKFITLILR